ncbi:hypothetical protein [Amycolatopsis jejuensis]|uniref:hypothetical protein n=1 Tax=Amycolatopsis jejuensis TaxID=330084 RepID=UPI0005277528|nr:hypothetical protein [Amycolatopsis jejuensis]
MSFTASKGRVITGLVAAAAIITGGTIGVAAASAAPVSGAHGVTASPADHAAAAPADDQPPAGARAVVKVEPNPAFRGDEVTITGNCGGGKGLKEVIGGVPGSPVLTDIKIVDASPENFVAKAKIGDKVGNGVGPVMVDCGGEAGVTLLVTHTHPKNQ